MNADAEQVRKIQRQTVTMLEERARLGVPHPMQPMSAEQRQQYRTQASRAHVPGVGITRPIATGGK
jgi:hypothetical protein